MPQMGYDMQEGTIVRWLKNEGAPVQIGDPIAEIETDKAVVEFESYATGTLRMITVSEGSTVPVGEVIAVVAEEDEDLSGLSLTSSSDAGDEPPPEPAAPEPAAEPEPAGPEPVSAPAVVASRASGPLRASPVARRLADERGIDITQLTGTGPGGRVVKQDVLSAVPAEAPAAESQTDEEPEDAVPIEAPAAEAAIVEEEPALEVSAEQDEEEEAEAPAEVDEEPVVEAVLVEEAPEAPAATAPEVASAGEKIPLSRMRQQIARVTVRSKREQPHFYITSDVDMTEAMSLRRQINQSLESQGVRISVNDMIVAACVGAIKRYPKFNSFFADDGIQMNDKINVGIAIAEEGGLTVPAILDCANKSLRDVSQAARDLIHRSQSGTLRPEEYTGSTFSTSNLGMFDVTSFTAIIHPPQTAVMAVGAVGKRPVVQGDEIVIREMMTATMSADHRVVDGAEGAQFMVEFKSLLETPLSLLV